MNKKKITHLALESYNGVYLNERKVNLISSLFNRSDLKKYITALKSLDNTKKIIVSSPGYIDQRSFSKIFPNKRIIVKKDSSLLLGVQIVDNDTVYRYSLKDTLNKIIENIEKDYD
ncbi:MAG: hypothetical protein HYT07_03030 [Candidatus Levybacteria bacterium]|nr:hypothetical protein [Candidatus Levybacteria bacterium]